MSDAPHTPAAFINAIAEEGSKKEAVEWLQKTWNERCHLERENEALRKDAERLNWIDEQGLCGFGHVGYGDYRVYCGKPFGNVRLAIDAARLPDIKEQSHG